MEADDVLEDYEEGEYIEEEQEARLNHYSRGVGRGKTSQRSRVARVLRDRAGIPRQDAWSVRNQERRRGRQDQHRQQLRGTRRGNRGNRGSRSRGQRGGRGAARGASREYRQQE